MRLHCTIAGQCAGRLISRFGVTCTPVNSLRKATPAFELSQSLIVLIGLEYLGPVTIVTVPAYDFEGYTISMVADNIFVFTGTVFVRFRKNHLSHDQPFYLPQLQLGRIPPHLLHLTGGEGRGSGPHGNCLGSSSGLGFGSFANFTPIDARRQI